MSKIDNLVITSLIDEEVPGLPRVVGTMQFYNLRGQITQDDLARVSFIRKLVGSTIMNCQYVTVTLQTIIGVNLKQDQMDDSRACVGEYLN